MANSKIVTAIGNIDGVNVKFSAGEPYTPGLTRYILNGRIHAQNSDDFSFTESNPGAGEITVSEAPVDGDVVQLFIVDLRPVVVSPVQQLTGTIRAPNKLQGALRPKKPPQLQATVSPKKLQGALRSPKPNQLQGVLQSKRLVGQLKKVC